MPPKSTVCAQCGIEFDDFPSNRRKYCCRRCYELSKRKPIHLRTCTICNQPINAYPYDTANAYAHRQTCSRQCGRVLSGRSNTGRVAWNKLPPIEPRDCAQCGEPFVPERSNVKTAKYCGRECQANARGAVMRLRRKRPWVSCSCCGKLIEATNYQLRSQKTVTCSRACMAQLKRQVTGEQHPLYKPKTRMTCEVCGTVRMVKPSLVNRFRACSRRCAAALGQESTPRTSTLETAIANELNRLNEPFVSQRRFHWYVVDFYLPDRNLVIEADGTYWHSLPNMQRIDKSKDGYMRTHGINIARLSEPDIRRDVIGAVRAVLSLHPKVYSATG